jgi:hypothetical protein
VSSQLYYREREAGIPCVLTLATVRLVGDRNLYFSSKRKLCVGEVSLVMHNNNKNTQHCNSNISNNDNNTDVRY